jgi:hypothetical protein
MNFDDVAGIIRTVLNITVEHIANGRRAEIRNERYFHHMFSFFMALRLWPTLADLTIAWRYLFINPEHPTAMLFQWGNLNINNAGDVAAHVVHNPAAAQPPVPGERGNIDFVIRSMPRVLVEWKGPYVYGQVDVIKDLLKLLTEPADDTKVFATIITSAVNAGQDHMAALVDRFNIGLDFCLQVLQHLGLPNHLPQLTLYACIATIPDTGAIQIHWGPVLGHIAPPQV